MLTLGDVAPGGVDDDCDLNHVSHALGVCTAHRHTEGAMDRVDRGVEVERSMWDVPLELLFPLLDRQPLYFQIGGIGTIMQRSCAMSNC